MSDDRPDGDDPDAPPPDPLLRVAGEILDGAGVDWIAAADDAGSYSDELRAIEALTRLSQSTPLTAWGPLRVLERVGAGAFSEVFRAWDTRLDREVALKFLHPGPESHTTETTAIAEGRLLAKVRHPNVVTVFGAEVIDGRVGIWTEFIHGETLSTVAARRGPLSVEETIAIGRDLCHALTAIHQAGVVHGDVKAQNVLRQTDGRIVLVDLGTGHEHIQDIAATPTREISGTPLYMAPELWRREPATPQSDVYSLGVLLYFLVTGRYPIRGATTDEVRRAHDEGHRVPLGDERADLPKPFVAVVERALDPNRHARFESANAIADALDRADPITTRRRGGRVIAVLAAFLVIGVAALWAWHALSSRPSRPAGSQPVFTQLTFQPPEKRVLTAAMSPDGQFVAYATTAGLVVQTISSREVHALAWPLNLNDNDDLAWLADSATVIVATETQLWRVPIDGSAPARIANVGGLIAVSPNGREIALTDGIGRRILALKSDGGHERVVVAARPGINLSRSSWSPNGERIAYGKHWAAPGGRRAAIASSPSDGGPETTVLDLPGLFHLVWGADNRLLFSRPQEQKSSRHHDLMSIDIDVNTGEPHGVPVPVVTGQSFTFRNPTLSRDGARLVFTAARLKNQAYIADFDRAQGTIANFRPIAFTSESDEPNGWMPGTGELLFRATGRRRAQVFVRPLGEPPSSRLLSPAIGEVEDAVVSPDGRWILYVQPPFLMRIAASGGPAEKLFDLGGANNQLRCAAGLASAMCVASARAENGIETRIVTFDPDQKTWRERPKLPSTAWDLSPDGREIAGVDEMDRAGHLNLLNLATNSVSRVTSSAFAGATSIAWAGTGDAWIVTKPLPPGGSQLLHIDRQFHTRVIWERADMQLLRAIVSPDGRHVAFARRFIDGNVWMLERF